MRYAKQRDINEPAIVAALEAAGCAVWKVGDMGVPDLIVSHGGVITLIEVKNPDAKGGAKQGGVRTKGHGALTPAQVKAWAKWEAMRGKPAVIVTTVDEALKAVGV